MLASSSRLPRGRKGVSKDDAGCYLVASRYRYRVERAGHREYRCNIRCLLARPKRFELLTPRFVVWCSVLPEPTIAQSGAGRRRHSPHRGRGGDPGGADTGRRNRFRSACCSPVEVLAYPINGPCSCCCLRTRSPRVSADIRRCESNLPKSQRRPFWTLRESARTR
jgi:hypothetical protein